MFWRSDLIRAQTVVGKSNPGDTVTVRVSNVTSDLAYINSACAACDQAPASVPENAKFVTVQINVRQHNAT